MDGKFSRSQSEADATEYEDEEISSSSGCNDTATKRDRFRRLAESRTNKALSAIAIIGNLSNHHVYEYEDAEVKKVVKALREAVGAVEERFSTPKTRTGGRFKL